MEIKEHTRILSSAKHLLNMLEETETTKVAQYTVIAETLQSDCHMCWLHLLELTLCAEGQCFHLSKSSTHENQSLQTREGGKLNTVVSPNVDGIVFKRREEAQLTHFDLDDSGVCVNSYEQKLLENTVADDNYCKASSPPDINLGFTNLGCESEHSENEGRCAKLMTRYTEEDIVANRNISVPSANPVSYCGQGEDLMCSTTASEFKPLTAESNEHSFHPSHHHLKESYVFIEQHTDNASEYAEQDAIRGTRNGIVVAKTEAKDHIRKRGIRKRARVSAAQSGRSFTHPTLSRTHNDDIPESVPTSELAVKCEDNAPVSTPPHQRDDSLERVGAIHLTENGENDQLSERVSLVLADSIEAGNNNAGLGDVHSGMTSKHRSPHTAEDRSSLLEVGNKLRPLLQDCSKPVSISSAVFASVDSSGSDDLEMNKHGGCLQSYLHVASRAEAIVRQRYQPGSLESWLGQLPKSPDHIASLASGVEDSSMVVIASLADGSVHSTDLSKLSSPLCSSNLALIKAERHRELFNADDGVEPPFNWDDYQVSLYSSSCDTEGVIEPVKQYVEEFTWDDDDLHLVTDLGADLSAAAAPDSGATSEIHEEDGKQDVQKDNSPGNQAVALSASPYAPFLSTQSSDKVGPSRLEAGDSLGRQDTMELLSTSTSVIFSQPVGGSGKHEVCTSAQLTNCPTGETVGDWPSGAAGTTIRAHPDGGSQNHLLGSSGDSDEAAVNQRSQVDPIYEAFWHKVEHLAGEVRRCRTLSFPVRRRRALLKFNDIYADTNVPGAPARRPPLGASLTHRPHRRLSSMSLIHHYSERQFNLISKELRQLMASPALLDNQAHNSGERKDCVDNAKYLSLADWQRALSDIIWRAEGNAALLEAAVGDSSSHSMESINSSNDNRSKSRPETPHHVFCTRDQSLSSPAKQTLLFKWMKLVNGARNRLLMSCSEEAVRSQLSPLRVRLKELNDNVRDVLQDMEYLGQVESASRTNRSPVVFDLRNRLNTQLKHCLAELESICCSVDRLRHLVDRKKSETSFSNLEHCQTTGRSTVAPSLLIPELGLGETIQELAAQLEANRMILSQVATIGLDPSNHEVATDPVEMGGNNSIPKHVFSCSEEVVHPELSAGGQLTRGSEPTVPCEENTSSPAGQFYSPVVPLLGGLLALAYIACSYVIVSVPSLLPCSTARDGDHGQTGVGNVWVRLLDHVSSWTGGGNHSNRACPYWLDRLSSSVVEFTQSAQPF